METVWHESGRPLPLDLDELRHAAISMLIARRSLHDTLPAGLIHDAALEMLLDLFAAHPRPVELRALLADTTLPPASARRWLAALEGEALVELDGERATLSETGLGRMRLMLTKVVESQRELLGWATH